MARSDPMATIENAALAASLRELADLLEQQRADRFRVNAYRRASEVIERQQTPVSQLYDSGGRRALEELPGVGPAIGAGLAELIVTGHWAQLERLRGTLEPERLLQTLPGIGPELAARICDQLHVESLGALELAAHDGNLDRIRGFGPRRVQMVRSSLSDRLGQPRLWRLRQVQPSPPVSLLLDVDAAYRREAGAGRLPTITPKRFNPFRRAWLPVMHLRRGPWHLTAIFSNTRRAHELGRIGDWVVIHYHTDHSSEGQCTVVTERRGRLKGKRVVRGREAESAMGAEPVTENPARASRAQAATTTSPPRRSSFAEAGQSCSEAPAESSVHRRPRRPAMPRQPESPRRHG